VEQRREPPERKSDHLRATDSELVRRARRGDDVASRELVDRYALPLFRLAFSLVGNAADAEDVVQETLSGALRSLGAFQERSSLKTWLTGILMRQAARCHRRRARHKAVSVDSLSDASRAAVRGLQTASATDGIDTRLDVMAALEALSEQHREVIVLREFEGCSYEEMAEILAVPRGTVESRLFRARQDLKELLSAYLP